MFGRYRLIWRFLGRSTRVTGNGEVTVRAEAACNRLPASLFPKSLNNTAIESAVNWFADARASISSSVKNSVSGQFELGG